MSEKQTIDQNAFDVKDFDAFTAEDGGSSEARRLIEAGTKDYAPFRDLFQDAHMSLFKSRPRLRDELEVEASHLANRSIIGQAMESAEYQKLRARSKGKPDVSAISSLALGTELAKRIPKEVKDAANKASQDAQNLESKLAEAQRALESGEGSEADLENLAQQMAKQQAAAKSAMADAVAGNEQAMDAAIVGATKAAQGKAEEYDGFTSAWGTGPGSVQTLPWRERLALAARVAKSEKLQAVAKLLGRFKEMALGKSKERTKNIASEVVGIELGNNIERALPSTLVQLAIPALRPLFLKDYAEGQLLQYKMEGIDFKGRGPMCVTIDESSSMGLDGKEFWAKAVALALASVAHKEKRDCRIISFASAGQLKVRDLPRSMGEAEFLKTSLDVAEHMFNGGTSFIDPLKACLEAIEKSPAYKEADVVFITDGECEVSKDFLAKWLDAKKRLEFTCLGIQCGGGSQECMESFCDEILPLTPGDVLNDKLANGVFSFAS